MDAAGGTNNNQRVRVAEVKRDTEHLTGMVQDLRDGQRRGQERQSDEMADLREHFDLRFEALRELVTCLARGLAVLETRENEWRMAHEREHEHERGATARRNLAVDIVSAAAAAVAGIFIQPGRGP